MEKSRKKMLSKELLEILACPDCKAAVKEEEQKIICYQCGRIYFIRDGIPVMLIEESILKSAL
jgi:uncharacterized protein YbaR (Trm112 family)